MLHTLLNYHPTQTGFIEVIGFVGYMRLLRLKGFIGLISSDRQPELKRRKTTATITNTNMIAFSDMI